MSQLLIWLLARLLCYLYKFPTHWQQKKPSGSVLIMLPGCQAMTLAKAPWVCTVLNSIHNIKMAPNFPIRSPFVFPLAVAEHLSAQHSAIKMLHSRVRLVLQYVKAVESGQLPVNREILREAYSLSNRLPVLQSPKFKGDFYNVSISLNVTASQVYELSIIK